MVAKKPKRKPLMNPIMIRLPEDLLAEIDAIAAQRIDRAERSGVIRELLREGLAARGKRGKK